MIGRLIRQILYALSRESEQEALQQEVQFHLDAEASQRKSDGLSQEQATAEAKARFGNPALIMDRTNDVWGMQWLDDLVRDSAIALRMLVKQPVFFITVLAIMTLSVGATTGTFSYFYELVLRKLPVYKPDELVLLKFSLPDKPATYNGYSYATYRDLSRHLTTVSGIIARGSNVLRVRLDEPAGTVNAEFVSGNYFEVLRVPPVAGRVLDTADELITAPPFPVVVSHKLRERLFGGDSNVVDRTFQLNQVAVRIVGVTGPEFAGTESGREYDLQIPVSAAPSFRISLERTVWLELMARRKSDVSTAQVEGEFASVATGMGRQSRDSLGRKYVVEDGRRGFSNKRGELERLVTLLSMAVFVLLLIACTNVAGLISARALERSTEMAVRLSLGATRGRLARQLFTENALLILLGAAGGLLIAKFLTTGLGRLLDDGSQSAQLQVGVDSPIFIASLGVSVITALTFGFFPAWLVKSGASLLTQSGSRGNSSGRSRMRRSIIVVQLTLSFALICGAAILARTLYNLKSVDLGFDIDHVAVLSIDSTASDLAGAMPRWEEAVERVRQLPGVSSAALSMIGVLSGDMIATVVRVNDTSVSINNSTHYLHAVGADYFRTLETTVLQGREFATNDYAQAPPVAIVNQQFASTYWPGQNAIGKIIDVSGRRQIVGVVANSNYRGVREQQPFTVYVPFESSPVATIFVRTKADPSGILSSVAKAINVDPALVVSTQTTLESRRDGSISKERALTFLSIFFAGLATVISVIGVAGVMMSNVVTRQGEIGIRLALGARPATIIALWGRETAALVLISVAMGIPLAWSSLTLLDDLVYGVNARDPLTLAFSVCILFGSSFLGAAGALRKAAKVDPAVALRAA